MSVTVRKNNSLTGFLKGMNRYEQALTDNFRIYSD